MDRHDGNERFCIKGIEIQQQNIKINISFFSHRKNEILEQWENLTFLFYNI